MDLQNHQIKNVYVYPIINMYKAINMSYPIINVYKAIIGSAVAQRYSAWLETEGQLVRASPASLRCVLEQDTLILA